MNLNLLKTSVIFSCVVIILLHISHSYSETAKDESPVIHVEKTLHTFPPVFEGVELNHTFKVSNRGSATLNIKKVTHS
jgi:hypothetical protein